MVQIKGSAIQETINQVKRRSGDDSLKKILNLLDDEARKVFEGDIFASTWYPLDVFTRFLEVEIKLLADGNEEMVTRGSEAVIERQLRGIYKAFVKLGSPEFVIKRIARSMPLIFKESLSTSSCRLAARPSSDTRALRNSTASWDLRSLAFSGRLWKFPAPKT